MKLLRTLLVSSLLLGGAADARRPNVVVILSDDHRHDWMGHKGKAFMATPQLDQLAREGISLDNAFACSGVCSPSRASILTGKYAHRASAPDITWRNNEDRKAAGERSMAIFNDRCNYPLSGKQELALFRCIASPGMGRIAAEIVAPAGSLQPVP